MSNSRPNLSRMLILAFAILVLSAGIFNAQPTNQAIAKELLTEQIKEYARRHAKTGLPMQTQMVVDLYRNNQVGMPSQEVAQTYEEEYVRLKEAHHPSPWEQ